MSNRKLFVIEISEKQRCKIINALLALPPEPEDTYESFDTDNNKSLANMLTNAESDGGVNSFVM